MLNLYLVLQLSVCKCGPILSGSALILEGRDVCVGEGRVLSIGER